MQTTADKLHTEWLHQRQIRDTSASQAARAVLRGQLATAMSYALTMDAADRAMIRL